MPATSTFDAPAPDPLHFVQYSVMLHTQREMRSMREGARVGGQISKANRRFTLVLSATKRAWLEAEAGRLDADCTPSDVLRGALDFFRGQSPRVREVAIQSPDGEEAGSGQTQRVSAP